MPIRYNPDGTATIIPKPAEIIPAETTALVPAVEIARPIAQQANPPPHVEVLPPQPPRHWPLTLIAYGFFFAAIWINVLNAGGFTNLANNPMVVIGILAEGGLFYLIQRAIHGPNRGVAIAVCVILFGYALWNDLRMATITAVDAEMARADRSTAGTERASDAVTKAQAAAVAACGPGLAKSRGCQLAQDNIADAKKAAQAAQAKVVASAKPESAGFVKFVSWGSFGWLRPSADDFDMWGLLFRMVLPQLGGVMLAFARR